MASSCRCRCRAQIDPDRMVAALDPAKDVDGLTPLNAGLLAHGTPGLVPCTPAGVIGLLRHEGVELEGAEAVVVGRSKLVGVPVARLLLAANATVTVCHSRTRDLPAVCRRADVLVAAVGVPGCSAPSGQAGGGRDRRRHEPHRGGALGDVD